MPAASRAATPWLELRRSHDYGAEVHYSMNRLHWKLEEVNLSSPEKKTEARVARRRHTARDGRWRCSAIIGKCDVSDTKQEIDGKGAWGFRKLVAKLVDLLTASTETATDGRTWQQRR
jgi:hypothetical protein